ncbi:MAG: hypothetical protein K6F77_07705 [Lachnospiraceae bacterium]|nr:hypothetical protein [Lachnospiraceae bacterium]
MSESIGRVYRKLNEPENRYKLDLMMASALIKNLHKEEMIDDKTYEKVLQNIKLDMAFSDKKCYNDNEVRKEGDSIDE